MKAMIDKYQTHEILARLASRPGPRPPPLERQGVGRDLPAFVKPICESPVRRLSDESVVHDESELRRRIAYIEREFDEPALVEEFLPGDEYTALVLGSGKTRECLPGLVTVEEQALPNYRILRSDLRASA